MTKFLAAAILFTAMPSVAHANGGGASSGTNGWCLTISPAGVAKYHPCKGR